MEDIILFGAVSNIECYFITLDKLNRFNVVEIWDNFFNGGISYNGNKMEVLRPYRPEIMKPILILSSRHEKEIREQLIQIGIPETYIKNWWYCFHHIRDEIIERYSKSCNPQIGAIVNYLNENELHIFNGGVFEKYQYRAKDYEVFFDEECDLYYSYWKRKKIYMKRGMNPNSIKNNLNALRTEQDISSPHCYEQLREIGRQDDVIVDAGAAEGFFSLERVDTAHHIYIVECDEDWVEALEHTFAPYRDKVTIIKSYIGDTNNDKCITLDKIDVMGAPITIVKMDIEGEEEHALEGGERLLSQNRNIDLIVCSYHKSEAYSDIAKILIRHQFELRASDGYMFFPYGDEIVPELRHGLIFAKKEKKYHIYIWGLGRYYKSLKRAIRNNCKVDGLLDSNKELLGDEEIMNPCILKEVSFDYVLVTAIHGEIIADSYKQMELPLEKIICLWDADETSYDFIDYDILKSIKQQYYLEKYSLRLANAPYEFSGKEEPKIIDGVVLLNEIYEGRKSLARFGDGEFEIMRMKERPWFQEVDEKLSNRLREVINSSFENVCLAIADNFGNLEKYTEAAADGIREYIATDNTREDIMKFLSTNRIYYDAYITRPYIIHKDKKGAKKIFELWKKIFNKRDLLIVEGKTSNMGKGNDLLSGVKSIHRILCPECNAFKKYSIILENILSNAKKSDLILIKLGPAATVMAYDLAKMGYQAIDVGQLDNEYDWFLMGVNKQVAIEGKTVAEAQYGRRPIQKYTLNNEEVLCCIE